MLLGLFDFDFSDSLLEKDNNNNNNNHAEYTVVNMDQEESQCCFALIKFKKKS